jgi:acetate kinase
MSSHLIRGSVERIGEENAQLKNTAPHGMSSQPLGAANHERALQSIVAMLSETTGLQKELLAVGHRLVHGGIGENASSIRATVIQQLGLFAFELDPERNAMHGARSNGRITRDGDRIAMVVPTDEELMIARETLAVLR